MALARERGAPRVLWVTEEPPDRTLGGGSIRQSHLFEALATAYPTELLAVGAPPDRWVSASAAATTELPRREAPRADGALGRRTLALGLAVGSRYPSALYPARRVRRDLARALEQRRRSYELVCVEHEGLAPVIPADRSGRWILTMHNLLAGMLETELGLAPGRRQRWIRERDLRKARALERRALERYDRCVVCSDEDAAALAALGVQHSRAGVDVIPNGVDLSRIVPTPLPSTPRVLFPGRLGWQPNVDGALWFCSQVWPQIRRAVPDASLALVGQSPAPAVRQLSERPGVEVHADVPSMRPYLESARVVVVPVRVGTGTRLKALEGMAAARPVVGTAVGLDGIGATDGVDALVADGADAFARAVLAAIQHDELARGLAEAGRAHVEARFGWDRIGAQFVELVSELLEADPSRASSNAA